MTQTLTYTDTYTHTQTHTYTRTRTQVAMRKASECADMGVVGPSVTQPAYAGAQVGAPASAGAPLSHGRRVRDRWTIWADCSHSRSQGGGSVHLEYALARTVNFSNRIQSDRATWDSWVESRELLRLALELEMRFDLLRENHCDFEMHLLTEALRYQLFPGEFYSDLVAPTRRSNRYLSNLLASTSLYLDQTRNDLCGIFGKTSSEVADFDNARQERHSECLGYRVLYILRNVMQHRKLAISSVRLAQSTEIDTPEQYHCMRFVPTLEIADFEELKKFDAGVLADLKKHAGASRQVNLAELVREYMDALDGVHSVARQLMAPDVQRAEKLLNQLVQQWTSEFGDSIVALALISHENGVFKETAPVFPDVVERRLALVRKNCLHTALAETYVSNRLADVKSGSARVGRGG